MPLPWLPAAGTTALGVLLLLPACRTSGTGDAAGDTTSAASPGSDVLRGDSSIGSQCAMLKGLTYPPQPAADAAWKGEGAPGAAQPALLPAGAATGACPPAATGGSRRRCAPLALLLVSPAGSPCGPAVPATPAGSHPWKPAGGCDPCCCCCCAAAAKGLDDLLLSLRSRLPRRRGAAEPSAAAATAAAPLPLPAAAAPGSPPLASGGSS